MPGVRRVSQGKLGQRLIVRFDRRDVAEDEAATGRLDLRGDADGLPPYVVDDEKDQEENAARENPA